MLHGHPGGTLALAAGAKHFPRQAEERVGAALCECARGERRRRPARGRSGAKGDERHAHGIGLLGQAMRGGEARVVALRGLGDQGVV